jgi:hypothetical protein
MESIFRNADLVVRHESECKFSDDSSTKIEKAIKGKSEGSSGLENCSIEDFEPKDLLGIRKMAYWEAACRVHLKTKIEPIESTPNALKIDLVKIERDCGDHQDEISSNNDDVGMIQE